MERYIPVRWWSIAICKIQQLIPICYLAVHPAQRPEPQLINPGGKPALHKGAFEGGQLEGPQVAR